MTRPTFESRVAVAGWRDHQFFGRSAFTELLGHESLSRLLFTSMDGRMADRTTSQVLDVVSAALTLADPRIPPLLLARIVASEGRALPGIASTLLACDHGRIGPFVSADAAQLLVDLQAEVGSFDDAREHALTKFLEDRHRQRRLPGFGVPFRGSDERVDALLSGLAAIPWSGPALAVSRRLAEITAARWELPVNVALPCGAIGLDLGLSPAATGLLFTMLCVHTVVANAEEGRTQRHPSLRRLGTPWTRYVGPAPRSSPRARAADEDRARREPT